MKKNFFDWLGGINCVTDIRGQGDAIIIGISKTREEDDVRELISVFRRYKINMAQLKIISDPKIDAWFKNPKNDWFKEIFRD